jgi:hypothetical protein
LFRSISSASVSLSMSILIPTSRIDHAPVRGLRAQLSFPACTRGYPHKKSARPCPRHPGDLAREPVLQ